MTNRLRAVKWVAALAMFAQDFWLPTRRWWQNLNLRDVRKPIGMLLVSMPRVAWSESRRVTTLLVRTAPADHSVTQDVGTILLFLTKHA